MNRLKLFALLLFALCLGSPAAWAQLASVPSAGLELTHLQVLRHAPQGLTIDQILSGSFGKFENQASLRISNDQWYRSVWLRLEIKTTAQTPADPEQAVLFFPKPYLDTVRLYQQSGSIGTSWIAQSAGDHISPNQWPLRSLYPEFLLPSVHQIKARGGQATVVYVEIQHDAPGVYDVHLGTAKSAVADAWLKLVIYGICFGMILLAAAITAAMAVFYRDQICAWYSAYALSALAACMSHSGIAHHLLWPVDGHWPGTAVLFFLLLCAVCQLQFCRAVATSVRSYVGLRWATHALCAACLITAMLLATYDTYWETWYYVTLACIATAMAITAILMMIGWRSGNRLARAWLLTFIPLFSTVVFSILEGIGLLSASYQTYSYVIYGVTLEVLLLGLALQWFARERHGERERLKTLASTDPLTGFLSAQSFESQLAKDWEMSKAKGRSLAVAYVRLESRAINSQHSQVLLTRCVRILRSATNAQDVVARLDGSLLALLMHDVPAGDELSQKLARVVALGLMPDANDRAVSILQFRIAATTNREFRKPLAELDTQMRELLVEPNGWGSKPIRYIDHTSKALSHAYLVETTLMEETWEAAFQQEMKTNAALSGSGSR